MKQFGGATGTLKPLAVLIKVSGRTCKVDYTTAFSCAHALLRNGHPREAASILRRLLKVRPTDRQSKLMLARCAARQEQYRTCMKILDALFKDEDMCLTAEFQAAFAFRNLGMTDEAVREMSNIVDRHEDLPTACLFLGDMLDRAGKREAAKKCWLLAIERDRRGGSVARAARVQIRSLHKGLATAKPPGQSQSPPSRRAPGRAG